MIDRILLLTFALFGAFLMTAVSSCFMVWRVRSSPGRAGPVSRVQVQQESKMDEAVPLSLWVAPYVCEWAVYLSNPAHARGFGMRWSLRSLPTQTVLWFPDNLCFYPTIEHIIKKSLLKNVCRCSPLAFFSFHLQTSCVSHVVQSSFLEKESTFEML